jgi:hypothetical protein
MPDINLVKAYDMPTGLTYIGRHELHEVGPSELEGSITLWDVTVHNTQKLHEALPGRARTERLKSLEEAMLSTHKQGIANHEYFNSIGFNPSPAIAITVLSQDTPSHI